MSKWREMNIQTGKLRVIEWISRIEDSDTVHFLQRIRENYTGEEETTPELSKEEMEGIERGLTDNEQGRVHEHESVRKIYEKYL